MTTLFFSFPLFSPFSLSLSPSSSPSPTHTHTHTHTHTQYNMHNSLTHIVTYHTHIHVPFLQWFVHYFLSKSIDCTLVHFLAFSLPSSQWVWSWHCRLRRACSSDDPYQILLYCTTLLTLAVRVLFFHTCPSSACNAA